LIIRNIIPLIVSSTRSHHAIILRWTEDSPILGLSQNSDDGPRNYDNTVFPTSPWLAPPPHITIQVDHFLSNETANTSSPFYLPEALQPSESANFTILQSTPFHKINFEDFCCPLAGDESKIKPHRLCWQGVCHTPRACRDSLYPFSGEGEKEYFRFRDDILHDINAKRLLRSRCDFRNRMITPPYKWCKQWLKNEGGTKHSDSVAEGVVVATAHFDGKLGMNPTHLEQYNHQNIDPYAAHLPPPGCSHFSYGGGSGSYHHVILFPLAKLAFCGIPKVGITQWIQFLRFTFGAKDYQASPYSKPDQRLLRFDLMREEVQKEILNDPEWKFAVFMRDPAERLLSTYLDKVRVNSGNGGMEAIHFRNVYNFTESPTFEEFVETIAKNKTHCPVRGGSKRENLHGADWCTDPHWRPQTMACGISEFLPRINYVGSLNHIESQTRTILQGELWERYGKYFHWNTKKEGKNKEPECASSPPQLRVGDSLYGFQQHPLDSGENIGKTRQSQVAKSKSIGAHHHATGSQSKVDEYYTPRLRRLVKETYRRDYQLWELIRDEKDVVSGSDLALKISGECRDAASQLAKA